MYENMIMMGMIKMVLDSFFFRVLGNRYRVNFLRKQGMQIGKDCLISGNVIVGAEPYLITIGNNVKLSNGVSLITHDGGVYVLRNYMQIKDADIFGKIVIGNNVFIGNKATIMPGVTVGNNCIIGYGAIVTKRIPDNSIAVGVPARVIEDIESYYQKNKMRILQTKSLTYEEKRRVVLETLFKQ